MATTGQPAPTGRPRDPAIDDRVLAAARTMLIETGWEATSVRGVAERACVSRAAVTRRWPSKAHLILDAILGAAPDLGPFEGVDTGGWVRWVARGSVEIFARPEVRAAAPGLLAALRDQPDLRDALWRTFTTEPVEIFVDHRRDHDDAALEAKAIIVLAAGAALFAASVAGPDDTPSLHEQIEAILLARTIPPR